jgi:hypothetical protein
MNRVCSCPIAPNADFPVLSKVLSERDQYTVFVSFGQDIAANGLLAAIPTGQIALIFLQIASQKAPDIHQQIPVGFDHLDPVGFQATCGVKPA